MPVSKLIHELINLLEDSKLNIYEIIALENLEKLQDYPRFQRELAIRNDEIKHIDDMIEKIKGYNND